MEAVLRPQVYLTEVKIQVLVRELKAAASLRAQTVPAVINQIKDLEIFILETL
jgi:hypothetical protein